MTDGVRLSRFAFTVIKAAAQFISRLAAQRITRVPEIRGSRLVGNISQHSTDLAILNLPECLTAKLKVVALLIDRITTVAVNQDAILDSGHQIIEAAVLGGRLQRNVRHARE